VLAAIPVTLDSETGVTWNLGCGVGHSVLEVSRSVERISGRAVPYDIAPRRPGDAAVLVAASDRARAAGWRPVHDDLDDIVRTAFAWRDSHPNGYGP
jgi:UDP-glucose 4-epimerase